METYPKLAVNYHVNKKSYTNVLLLLIFAHFVCRFGEASVDVQETIKSLTYFFSTEVKLEEVGNAQFMYMRVMSSDQLSFYPLGNEN